ncbi:MAG: peptidylprolyl isomerase [Bacteroidetes bacterium CG2_30_33_31]|nr:MAG: peptidylprolyl isomerase [Bacteroidetes bacterium CG2_30_33_31]
MIAKNKVVSLNYRLTKSDASGELIEETYGSQPMTFLYGVGMMIPKFEAELQGKSKAEKFSFGIAAEQAYGLNNPEMVVDLPLNIFENEGKIDYSIIKIGNMLPMQDNEGNHLHGIIKEISDNTVKMDFNHPLSSQDLYFEGEIVDVREATAEDLQHGHVHGPEDHHH